MLIFEGLQDSGRGSQTLVGFLTTTIFGETFDARPSILYDDMLPFAACN